MTTSRVLLGLASALGLAATGCGSSGEPSGTASPPAPATSTATVPTVRAAPGTPQPAAPADVPIPSGVAIGQMLVTRYHGATPTPSVLESLRRGRVGGVILFADNVPSPSATRRATRQLLRAADEGRQPRPLILIDQEGGDVKRLGGLPPDESAAAIGASSSPAIRAREEGRKTGRALRRLGIDVDLAPVADVPGPGSFLGTRAYSRSPNVVARAACGFVEGLQDERVSATLKHFPGLGRATGNTDLEPVAVDASARRIVADLAAYRRCGAGADFVMLSSASYPSLGIRRPAVLASRTYRLLASQGVTGITISDAFDTPAIEAHDRPAFQAVRAGLDILLFTTGERPARVAYSRLLADVRAGRLSRDRVQDAARRIVDFKAGTGQP